MTAPSASTAAPIGSAATTPSLNACGVAYEPCALNTVASTATPMTPPSSRIAFVAPDAWPASSGRTGAEDRVRRRREHERHAGAGDDERRDQARVGGVGRGDHRQPEQRDRLQREAGDHQRPRADPVAQQARRSAR